MKSFKEKLKYEDTDSLDKRACVAILECIGNDCSSTWHPRVIVVSFHSPYKITERPEKVAHFFNALDYLGQMTGYPVLVGGDFNCELLKGKVDTNGFIVPKYNPTIHRVLYSNTCIDFFAYKNCEGRRACSVIQLTDVHAELVLPNDVLLVGNNEINLHQNEYKNIKDAVLSKIHNISDHDPLKATLILRNVLPIYHLSCIFMNSPSDQLKDIQPIYDFLLIYNINKDFELPPLVRHYYDKIEELSDIAQLYLNSCRLKHIKNTTLSFGALTCSLCELNCTEEPGLTAFVALLYKSNGKDTFTDGYEYIKEKTYCDSAWIMMGNMEISKNVITKLKSFDISIIREWNNNNYFCAWWIYNEVSTSKLINVNVHFDTISMYLEMNTEGKIVCNNQEINIGDLSHVIAKISNCHHDLLSFKLFEINLLITAKFQIVCFNMSALHESLIDFKTYFTKLNPKPDLFILQKPSQGSLCEMLGVEHSHHAYCGSTIICNTEKFKLVSEIKFTELSPGVTITACILSCCTITGTPNIIIVSFHNSCKQDNPTKVDNVTQNFQKAEECFDILDKMFTTFNYPVLVAGGFYIELDKAHKILADEQESTQNTDEQRSTQNDKQKQKQRPTRKDRQINIKNFQVPEHNPSLYRVLHAVINHKRDVCTDTFAYKSSDTWTITLDDVHAESGISFPGLVTGPGGYNIDYDKLPTQIAKHDPVRAELTITGTPPRAKSTITGTPPASQTPESQ